MIGFDKRAFVVAELGVNHQGSRATLLALARAAIDAGADAVKIQRRTPELHARQDVMRPSCTEPGGALISDLEHRRRMELTEADLDALDKCCAAYGVPWFASCWDVTSVELQAARRPTLWKIASASLTDASVLKATRAAADETGAWVFASTGMSTIEEIRDAVDILGRERLALLHCCSAYPAENDECNLRLMDELGREFRVPIGWSGHERGIQVSVAAVAMGARIVERHITLDRTMPGSDHAASLEPHGFRQMVRDIRVVEAAMGDGVRRLSEREQAQRARLRRVP